MRNTSCSSRVGTTLADSTPGLIMVPLESNSTNTIMDTERFMNVLMEEDGAVVEVDGVKLA